MKKKKKLTFPQSYVGLFLAWFSSFHCLALGSMSVHVLHGWGLERHEKKVLSNVQWFCTQGAGHGIFLDQDNGRNTSVAGA